MDNIIEIKDLTVDFTLNYGTIRAVNHVDFEIPKGQVTALVGESGSGKSTLATAILNLVPNPGKIISGQIIYKGEDIVKYNNAQLENYRWADVSMVFQAAQNSLNPLVKIKDQMIETVQVHTDKYSEPEILDKASNLLERVRLEPERVLDSYPHELSGGMKQRAMLAFSLLLEPSLIILDEPTTALDVITQAYIFDMLKGLHEETNVAMLLLTHDIAVVAKVADRVGVMYAGRIVEIGEIFDVFSDPKHPYTKGLLKSIPSLVGDLEDLSPIEGSPPSLIELPSGCPFQPRCPYVNSVEDPSVDVKLLCKNLQPEPKKLENGTVVECHLYDYDKISNSKE